MKLKQQDFYAYRLFAGNHALMALFPFSSLEELWKAVETNSLLYFITPDKSGGSIEGSIRTDSITAIDRPWGVEPVSQKVSPNIDKGVTNRATIKQGKIVLGQTAKREKK